MGVFWTDPIGVTPKDLGALEDIAGASVPGPGDAPDPVVRLVHVGGKADGPYDPCWRGGVEVPSVFFPPDNRLTHRRAGQHRQRVPAQASAAQPAPRGCATPEADFDQHSQR
jgi:hypothetical protein